VWVPDVPGGGGVRIEDMVLITEGAARILSRVEYEERLMV
jgi:Xaa-Pro aminopeptidase